jgi:hypothetical protein
MYGLAARMSVGQHGEREAAGDRDGQGAVGGVGERLCQGGATAVLVMVSTRMKLPNASAAAFRIVLPAIGWA